MDKKGDCSMVKLEGKFRKDGHISTASGECCDFAGSTSVVAIYHCIGNYRR